MNLQYQLSNGAWIDCEERTQEFLDLCVAHNSDINSVEDAEQALLAGRTLRNDSSDWYSNCRAKPAPRPVAEFPADTTDDSGYDSYEY